MVAIARNWAPDLAAPAPAPAPASHDLALERERYEGAQTACNGDHGVSEVAIKGHTRRSYSAHEVL